MEKLVLIDGNSLINRAFYAMPLLITKDGVYTNAVYGFLNMFFKMLSEQKPTYCAVAFDVHAKTFRHKMFEDYKGKRKPMPEELRPQLGLLKDILRLMNVTVIEQAGIEADDIIGTIAKNTSVATYIYTGDKDSFQLVDEETSVCFTKRGITDLEVYEQSNFKEKTGLVPKQIIDLKSLMGDASDNIPGVAGIGEKTALSLLEKYGSLDGVYQNIDNITGKLKEKLITGKEQAYLSYELATICTSCDVDTDVAKMVIKTPFSPSVRQKFIDLEFKSLSSRKELFIDVEDESADKSIPSLGEEQEEKNERIEKKVYVDLSLPTDFFSGTEYTIAILERKICVYSAKKEYQIAIKGENLLDEGVLLSEALKFLYPVFRKNNKVIVYDKKKLYHLYNQLGESIEGFDVEDVSIMKYLADFSGGAQSLDEFLSEDALGLEYPAFALNNRYLQLLEQIKSQDLEKLYYEIELPLVDVLFSMETIGFKIDYEALQKTGEVYAKKVKELESKICQLAGNENLNVNSPKQLGELLFEQLKIGKGKKKKTGYSTSAEVLESLEDAHEIVPLILQYRKIQKIQSTYIEGFKPLIDKSSGLIHTSFNQTLTATGRLSSKEPNLQNIPIKEEMGKELRKFFVPKSKDRLIISADYSQIELRLLASFSKCEHLIESFNRGEDVHSSTASKVFNVPLDKVTPLERRNAKAVNFGIIYGMSEYGLAKNIKTTPKLAKEYIDSYFSEFPEVKAYMQQNVEFAKANGYALTLLKRRRYIRELQSTNYNLRSFGERVAMNMPLQGSAADIIKIAMLNVYNRLKKEKLKSELILQVHDELIIDAFKDEKEEVIKILKEEMEGAVKLLVKLTVEVSSGETWFDAK